MDTREEPSSVFGCRVTVLQCSIEEPVGPSKDSKAGLRIHTGYTGAYRSGASMVDRAAEIGSLPLADLTSTLILALTGNTDLTLI